MIRSSHLGIVLAALLLVGATPALAAPTATPVPIHGTTLGFSEPDFTAPGCAPGAIWRFNGSGSGQLSHLGRVEFTLTHCTYMEPDGTATFGDGTITYTAANGDTLVIAQEGTAYVIADASGFLGWTADGTWTVVGGTGRFAHATGHGSMDWVGDVPGGDTRFGLEDGQDRIAIGGAIAYVASDRSR